MSPPYNYSVQVTQCRGWTIISTQAILVTFHLRWLSHNLLRENCQLFSSNRHVFRQNKPTSLSMPPLKQNYLQSTILLFAIYYSCFILLK